MLSIGCSTPPKGTGDTAKPLRPMDDADTDADDADADDADADDGTTGDDGGVDTAEEPEDPPLPYELEFTPPQVNFGPVSVGLSQSEIINVRNVGLESIHINGVAITDRAAFDFDTDFTPPITLTPGMARTIRVSFEPSEATTYSEQITFLIEETLEDVALIPLQGRGEAADCDIGSPIIDVSPRSLTIDT